MIAPQRSSGLPLYLIPIMLGLCGLLFATQLDSPMLRTAVIIISVAIPMFAGGNLLGRVQSRGFQRVALIGGIVFLILGAMVTVADFGGSFLTEWYVSEEVSQISRWLGLFSLFLGLITVLVNVVRREEQIETVAGQFRFLADHMSEGFILTDLEGKVQIVNKAFTKMVQLPPGDLIGQDARTLAKKLDMEAILANFDKRESGRITEYHVPWNVNGEERQLWFHGTPIFDRQGQFAGTLATVRDITEQHQLSQRLERYTLGLQELVEDRTEKLYQSEERMRSLVLNMNEGFLTIDDRYRIRFANDRMAQLLQRDVADLGGTDLFECVDPADRGKILSLLRGTDPSGGHRSQQDIFLVREDGDRVPVVVAAAPVHETPDELARFSLVVTDVSEMKAMQVQVEQRARELEEANAELRQLDRAKDGFLSNVTHELRTPLSTIRGYVEMFSSGSLGELQGPQEAALRVMMRNVERLGTLIDEIIEFSRMEIRGIHLSQSLFGAEGLVRECADSIRPQAVSRDITLDVYAPEEPLYLWGDRKRLAQVMTILLANAVKFSQTGDHVRVGAEVRAGMVAFVVADTGIGIDARYHRRVFDKFFQVDATLSRRYEGAGIGLSIARSIVDAHGGVIELDSEPRKGSTFTVELPQARWELDSIPEVPGSDESPRVLIFIEPDELARSIESTLARAGYRVDRADTAFAGLRRVSDDPPDLVVVDETLPDLSGTAIVGRLREDLSTSELPVLLLLSRTVSHGAEDRVERSAGSLLYKPFTPVEFLRLVSETLERDMLEVIEPEPAPDGGAAATVLLSSEDPEFDDWLTVALRRHGVACLHAATLDDARELARERSPRAVLVDTDGAIASSERILDGYQGLATEADLPLLVLTSTRPEQWEGYEAARVLRKPFSASAVLDIIGTEDTVETET